MHKDLYSLLFTFASSLGSQCMPRSCMFWISPFSYGVALGLQCKASCFAKNAFTWRACDADIVPFSWNVIFCWQCHRKWPCSPIAKYLLSLSRNDNQFASASGESAWKHAISSTCTGMYLSPARWEVVSSFGGPMKKHGSYADCVNPSAIRCAENCCQ